MQNIIFNIYENVVKIVFYKFYRFCRIILLLILKSKITENSILQTNSVDSIKFNSEKLECTHKVTIADFGINYRKSGEKYAINKLKRKF